MPVFLRLAHLGEWTLGWGGQIRLQSCVAAGPRVGPGALRWDPPEWTWDVGLRPSRNSFLCLLSSTPQHTPRHTTPPAGSTRRYEKSLVSLASASPQWAGPVITQNHNFLTCKVQLIIFIPKGNCENLNYCYCLAHGRARKCSFIYS